MPITSNDIKSWLKNFEDQTMDRKSIGILDHAYTLAELMVAFANNKSVTQDFGGRIIIGINDDGIVERFTPKQGHEELIMNVARNNCRPPIRPEFEKVDFDGNTVYVITIPKMINNPYQVKTSGGYAHKIRVGSTIKDPTEEELKELYIDNLPESGIDSSADTALVRWILKIGRKYLQKKYGRLDVSLDNTIKILKGIAIGLCVPLFSVTFWFLFTRTFNPDIVPIIFGLGFLMMGMGPCFYFIRLIKNRKCEMCKSNFTLEKIKSKLLEEKQIGVKLRRITNNTYHCKFCKNTSTKKEAQYYDT